MSYRISVNGLLKCFAKIDNTNGWQNPPWHLPNPARVRFFKAFTEFKGTLRDNSSSISPRVTFSQLQMILPYDVLFLIISLSYFLSIFYGCNLFLIVFEAFSLISRWIILDKNSSTTYLAMAGDEANPGDSMPIALMKWLLFLAKPIIKSCVEGVALNPANVLIHWSNGIFFTINLACDLTLSKVGLSVDKSSLSLTHSDDGPTRKLLDVVGETNTPFPLLEGRGKIVWLTKLYANWAKTKYSPLRRLIDSSID